MSLSAIISNGEMKGGGSYYLISRTTGPELGITFLQHNIGK